MTHGLTLDLSARDIACIIVDTLPEGMERFDLPDLKLTSAKFKDDGYVELTFNSEIRDKRMEEMVQSMSEQMTETKRDPLTITVPPGGTIDPTDRKAFYEFVRFAREARGLPFISLKTFLLAAQSTHARNLMDRFENWMDADLGEE